MPEPRRCEPREDGNAIRRDALVAAVLLAAGPACAADAEQARLFVDRLGQRTIAALDQVGDDAAARRRAIAALLDESVDLTLIARLTCRTWTAPGL